MNPACFSSMQISSPHIFKICSESRGTLFCGMFSKPFKKTRSSCVIGPKKTIGFASSKQWLRSHQGVNTSVEVQCSPRDSEHQRVDSRVVSTLVLHIFSVLVFLKST